MEIAILSDAEFKTLDDKDTQRTHWVWQTHREEIKPTLSEIKETPQGTNCEGKKVGVQINDLEHKKERMNQYKMKKQEFKNQGETKKTLGHLQKGQHPNL